MKKILPPNYLFMLIGLQIILHFLLPIYYLSWEIFLFCGIVFLTGGISLNLWSDKLFKRHKTTVKPFEESSSLIQEGPFRLSRNPMYLGMLLILLGISFLLGSLSAFIAPLVFFIISNNWFISKEEALMDKKFGKSYDKYKSSVRRWI